MEITGLMIQSAELLDIIEESENTYTYRFSIPKGMTWDAGTNAHLVATGSDKNFTPSKESVRHLSICSLPDEGYIGFSTRIREGASIFKQNLKVTEPGDKLQVFGLKNRLPLLRLDKPVVMISMGVGIATFRPMVLEYAQDQKGIPNLINLNIDKVGSAIYKDEMSKFNIKGFESYYVNSRSALQQKINDLLKLENAEFHIVGSDEFLLETGTYLLNNGIAESQIKLDKKEGRYMIMLENMKKSRN